MTDASSRHVLRGGGETLLFEVRDGRPRLVAWGAGLDPAALDPRWFDPATPHGMLDAGEALDLVPQAGLGYAGAPGFEVSRAVAAGLTQAVCTEVRERVGGLEFRLEDAAAGVLLTLEVELDGETGVASFASRIANTGETPLQVQTLAAITLPVPGDEVLAFSGRWAREMQFERRRLGAGAWVHEGRTGRTSHHAPPFLVVGQPGFDDDTGEVFAVHLAWSGNHTMRVERLRDGRVALQAAALLLPGEIVLEPGEAFDSPRLYVARADDGLNGLSHRLHRFVRSKVLPPGLATRPRPVTFSTWEAIYFDHQPTALETLAERAAALGVERFVLDDGWFRGRDNDRTSLGDWTADVSKYPDGLGPLIQRVNDLGMAFGLWVEPEMANARSDLLEAHPDWRLGDPDRVQPLGRQQYVLDLTRPEVSDAIFRQLDALLTEHPIAFLKWDMNRDLTHAVSRGRWAADAQTRAAYALIDRVRAAHPRVEIEACASGGARADYEILRRTERIWTSDCNDPIDRQQIQAAFALFFPAEVMGAHIGPETAHTTGRSTPLATRAMTAVFGHMGLELDLRALTPEDEAQVRAAIALHKRFRPLLHGGRRIRLRPLDDAMLAFMVADETRALVSVAQLASPRHPMPAPLRLPHLDPAAVWTVRWLNPPAHPERTMKVIPPLARGETLAATGALLATAGLPLPVLRTHEVAVFHLERR